MPLAPGDNYFSSFWYSMLYIGFSLLYCSPIATTSHTTEEIKMATKKKERYVLITTEHRGVFAGFASNTDGDVIKLRAARNCISWSSSIKGFLGLASVGPDNNCKIGPAADLELRKITSVAEVTAEAQAKWESAPWAR